MGKQLNVENSVISAKDDALFYNAMIQKNGVWQYGNKLEYEIISANQINIKDGMVTAQGRNYVIYPNEVDSLTIENGTVNTKRYDLIVYEVSKTSEGEQVGLKVIKGTNATTPTDPTLTQDDTLASGSKYQMPLYRVRLNGINIEGVDDLREYIVSFGNLVNDNLLLNSDFRNVINQRGQTNYTFKGAGVMYTIDRWAMNYASSLTVNDGYVSFIGDANCNCHWIQDFEKPLSGTFTCSFNVLNTTGDFRVYALIDGIEDITPIKQGLNTIQINGSNITRIGFCALKSGASTDIEWIKLEPGSIATPFVPRPYGEELALCQRYYQIYKDTDLRLSPILTEYGQTEYATISMELPVPLMATPTVIVDNVHLIKESDASWNAVTGIHLVRSYGSLINFVVNTNVQEKTVYRPIILGTSGGYISFDAELR